MVKFHIAKWECNSNTQDQSEAGQARNNAYNNN